MRRFLSLFLLVFPIACAHTGQRTMCMKQPFGGGVICRTRDYDAENRQKAERERAIALNDCVEKRQQSNAAESFADARSRCELAISAQIAAAEQGEQ